jgi:hypothetical protein
MSRADIVKVIVVLAFVALVLGCCAMLPGFRSGSGGGELLTTPHLNNSHIVYLNVSLTKGGEAWVHVVSDHPVDILVMDRENFTNYYETEQGNVTAWSSYAAAVNLTDGGLNFTAPSERNYLFVIDNTPLNEGGAPGDTLVNYSVKHEYHWSNYPAPLSWLIGN